MPIRIKVVAIGVLRLINSMLMISVVFIFAAAKWVKTLSR